MEASLDSIVTLDRHGRVRRTQSHRRAHLWLWPRPGLGRELQPPLLAGSARSNFYALLREGRRAQREGREPQTRSELLALRADGTRVPVEVSVVPIQLEDELFHTLYIHDITKRKEREREIEPGGLCQREPPSHPARQPPPATCLHQRASEPLLRIGASRAGPLPAKWAGPGARGPGRGPPRERESTATARSMPCLFAPVSELGYVNIYARDITAVRRAEQESRQHQAELVHVCRLSTMGEVATGMAHELNQPPGGHRQLCQRLWPAPASGDRRAGGTGPGHGPIAQPGPAGQGDHSPPAGPGGQAGAGARRGGSQSPGARRSAPLSSSRPPSWGCNIELDLAVGEIPVRVDLVQIEQVLLNLVRNALDALEEAPPRRRRLTIRGRREGHWAVATVEDTGPGVEPERMASCSILLYHQEGGMGMGLPISQTILDNHDGEIRVDSEPGVGTRFQVCLPLASEADPV